MFVTSISFRGTIKSFWDLNGRSAILVQSALLSFSQPDLQNQSIFAKEPYILAKEPYILAKEPYVCASDGASAPSPIFGALAQRTIFSQKSSVFSQKSSVFSQKSPVFS